MEFRIQDCLGFPYMGRQGDALTPDIRLKWNSLMTFIFFIYLSSVISNEDGFEIKEISIK